MFNKYPVNSELDTFEVDTPSFWNNIYKSGNPAWGKAPSPALDKFEPYFTGNTVLDLGCGEGRNSVELENRGYTVTGIDVSEEAIGTAKSKESNVNFLCLSLTQDPWPDETYDVIIDFGLFHFMPYEYRASYVSLIKSHLNEGGVYCNQAGRLTINPIVGPYTPPQLEEEEIRTNFADFEFLLMEEDTLPPHSTFGKYPCWNFVVKK